MSETKETMGIEMTPEELTQIKFNRKLKEYEKDEAFMALADYGLRDALIAKPSVIANDNVEAYEMMVEQAKARMNAEMSKQETKVDEPLKMPVETKAPIVPKADAVPVNNGIESDLDFTGMDIYDRDKMKNVKMDNTAAMFIEITRPQQELKYDI